MAKKPEFEQPLQSVTKEERRDATSIIPQKIKIVNGCPTKEVKVVNDTIDTFVKISRKQSKRAEEAMEVNDWLFQGIRDSLNPKNNGVVEEYWIDNPDFDKSKPPCEKTNPFLVKDYRHKYDPFRYKENTISAAVQNNLKGYEDLLKKIQTVEKESRIQLAKDNRDMVEQKSNEVEEDDSIGSLVSFEYEDDNPTVN